MNTEDIVNKISAILNGTDTEITENRPFDFRFLVQSQATHLDEIQEMETGFNLFPVFVSNNGAKSYL